MNDPLPIKQIFLEGIKMPFANHKELIRLGWPYACLMLSSSFVADETDSIVLKITYLAIFYITGILGIVGCHRVFLLPKKVVNETLTFRWSPRETKFLFCMLAVSILAFFISMPFLTVIFNIIDFELINGEDYQIFFEIILTISFIPISYIISRFSLIFPDTAVGNNRTLLWAWNISSGYSFKLFILIGVLPLTTEYMFELIENFVDTTYILSFIKSALWLMVMVIEICFLSLSYKWIVSKQDKSDCNPEMLT